MYFQLVESQVLSSQGQPDVNLHPCSVDFGKPEQQHDDFKWGIAPVELHVIKDPKTVGMRNRLL